jgi:DNA repair photolyase
MVDTNSCQKISCSSALNRLKRKIPYGWDLNIYRGCSHNCSYCYARYSHDYLGEDDFTKVFVKTNIVEQLDKELSSPSWKREVINIGGVTDSYQKIEEEMLIMPDILKLLIKYKTPAIISTKSHLILRDFDLIAQLAEITYVNVASTITTMDESVRLKIEPNASSAADRFIMLKEFRKTNASVGLHVMPIIPLLTDSKENIETLCAGAKRADVHYMLPGVLYLRGVTRKHFFDFINREYPDIYDKLRELYKGGGADKSYKEALYSKVVNPLRERYGIPSSYMKAMKEKLK